jgi:outer membrane protein OmpA-like peptidoglycan-associated protein
MMKMKMNPKKRHRGIAIGLAISALLVIVPMGTPEVSATEAGPGGVNIGFNFTWDDARNPAGHSASFLETDGISANNCSGNAMLPSTRTCNFVFDYRVNGVQQAATTPAARYVKWANPTAYAGGKPVGSTGCSSPETTTGNFGKAPLTLFDCFNNGGFGQLFRPTQNGALTQFRMSMACLAPSGTPRFELYALLYEMSNDGNTVVSAAPLGATMVNLSKCPTSSTWNNKSFRASDFAMTAMTFRDPQVAAGKFYGLYFTGPGVPGALPPGAAAAMAAAKAISTVTTTTTTTTTTPWSAFKGERNTSTAATPSSGSQIFAALGSSQTEMSALRLMTAAQNKTYYINSLTPNVCLGSDRNLVFVKKGTCRTQVVTRRNGRIVTTVSTRVVAGEVSPSEAIVAVPAPTVLIFANGTNRLAPASMRKLNALMPEARRASSILVAGHTGNASGENTNLVALSQKRATLVRSLLRGRGARQTIAIKSFGGSNPISTSKSEKQQQLNRRAEIYLIP